MEILSALSSNANTCEFKLPTNNLADVPSEPSPPCRDFVNDIVLDNDTEELAAVIDTEPESCVRADIVNTFPFEPPNVEVTPVPSDLV